MEFGLILLIIITFICITGIIFLLSDDQKTEKYKEWKGRRKNEKTII